MKVEIEIQTNTERDTLERKGDSSKAIFDLKEVQAIKTAIQEHILFIGLDRGNNIKAIRLIGVGNSGEIYLDHIIVTEKDYYSMGKYNEINYEFKNDRLNFIENTFLKEENQKLNEKIDMLINKLEKNKVDKYKKI